jgi:hypothetical protein
MPSLAPPREFGRRGRDARWSKAISQVWESMSELEQWWAAFNKSLGPGPTFAPAALILVSRLVIVASQRHPALAR